YEAKPNKTVINGISLKGYGKPPPTQRGFSFGLATSRSTAARPPYARLATTIFRRYLRPCFAGYPAQSQVLVEQSCLLLPSQGRAPLKVRSFRSCSSRALWLAQSLPRQRYSGGC